MIFGGRKGAALLFMRECVFLGTMNAEYWVSRFCQNLYVYMISGVARGQRPLALENFLFGELNMHNLSPLLVQITEICDFWWSQA